MYFEKTLRLKELLENRRNEASYVSGRIKVGSQEHNAVMNTLTEISKNAVDRDEREAARIELEERAFATQPKKLANGFMTSQLTRTLVQKPYLSEDERKLFQETYTLEAQAFEGKLNDLEKQLLNRASDFLADIKSIEDERADLYALAKEVERIPLDMEQYNFSAKFMYGSPIESRTLAYSRIELPLRLLSFSIVQDRIDAHTKRLIDELFRAWKKLFR